VDRPEYSQDLKTRLLTESSDNSTLVITAIHGLGSVGKSTLAAALAHDKDVQTHFCDGILWAILGQQPNLLSLLSGWVQALGDYNFKATSVEAASNQLRTLLYDKAVLLVVDDAWNPENAQPFNVGGARCQVLVTTREAGIAQVLGASTYSLDVMQPSQAMELLTKKLGRKLTDTEIQPAEVLAKELGYLPLALELAAVQVAGGISWTVLVQDMQKEVARLRTIDDKAARDANDETSLKRLSLTASLNLSIQRLSQETRENFIWLGILPEDVTITGQMAVTLWDMDDERDAADELGYLHSKALLLSGIPLVDKTPTYRLHDLFHDLARNLLTFPPTPKRRGDLLGLGMTLAHAHATFLEKYRQKTQNNLWHTLPDDGYIHQHLVWHLEKAEQIEEIHSLLLEESQTRRNGWYEACDKIGQMANFVTDIALAWKLAEDLYEVNPSKSIALQIRYALIATSLNSITKNIPAELMAALIEKQIWTPLQGWAYVQQLQNSYPFEWAQAIKALVPHWPKNLLFQVLEITLAMKPGQPQANALIGLAPYLPENLPQILAQTLEAVHAIPDEFFRSQALAALAEYLPDTLLSQALEIADDIKWERYRAETLSALAPKIPVNLLPKVLAAARRLWDGRERVKALSALAYYEPKILPEALQIARSLNPLQRPSALTILAHQRPKILPKALKAIRTSTDLTNRVKAILLGRLLQDFPEVSSEALKAACAIEYPLERGETLAELAPYLPKHLLPKVLEAALSIAALGIHCEYPCTLVLSALAPRLPRELLLVAVESVRAMKTEDRLIALSHLAISLPEVIPEALAVAREIQDEYQCKKALKILAPHLPKILLPQALEIARIIQDDYQRLKALISLASQLPELLPEALESVCTLQEEGERAGALVGLSPHLPDTLLPRAMEIARALQSYYARTPALVALVPHCPESLPEVLEFACFYGSHECAKTLVELVPHLPNTLLPQALEFARAIHDPGSRVLALSTLVPYRPEIIPEVLSLAEDVTDKSECKDALIALAPHLSEHLLLEVLEIAQAIKDLDSRAKALGGLALHLPMTLLPEALKAAQAIEEEYPRAIALGTIALHQPEIAPQVFKAIRAISDQEARYRTLFELAPNLSKDLVPQFLEIAHSSQKDSFRLIVLMRLAQHRPEVLTEAYEIAHFVQNGYKTVGVFVDMVPYLDLFSDKLAFWCQLLHVLALNKREDLLKAIPDLIPAIITLGSEKTLIATARAIQDVGHWWP
jgi:NB-ARC domain/APAF-1 helical domain